MSKDLIEVVLLKKKECLISSSDVEMQVPRDSTIVSERSFSISRCLVRVIDGS